MITDGQESRRQGLRKRHDNWRLDMGCHTVPYDWSLNWKRSWLNFVRGPRKWSWVSKNGLKVEANRSEKFVECMQDQEANNYGSRPKYGIKSKKVSKVHHAQTDQ